MQIIHSSNKLCEESGKQNQWSASRHISWNSHLVGKFLMNAERCSAVRQGIEIHPSHLYDFRTHTLATSRLLHFIHVFLEIKIKKFENEVELGFGMDNV